MRTSIRNTRSLLLLFFSLTVFTGYASSEESTSGSPDVSTTAMADEASDPQDLPPKNSNLSVLFDTTIVEPVKLFDTVYYVGYRGVGSFILNTSEGIIVIDTMWNSNDAKNVIVPGIQKLGLDPARIKYVVITHGHSDHFGGARYLEENFGATVFMSKIDWNYMTDPSVRVMKDPFGNMSDRAPKPSTYTELQDGQKLTLGDTTLTVVQTPGHTPGCLSFLIPVKDEGVPHVVAIWGGTGLPATLQDNEAYLTSLNKFENLANAAHVDAEMSIHPFVNHLLEKMAILQTRQQEDANPIIIGNEAFQEYVDSSLRNGVVKKITDFQNS